MNKYYNMDEVIKKANSAPLTYFFFLSLSQILNKKANK